MFEQVDDGDVVGSGTTADESQAAGCVEARRMVAFHTAPMELEIGGRPVSEVIAAWLQQRGFPVGAGVRYHGWNGAGDSDRPPEIGISDELIRLSTEGVSVEAGYTRSESRARFLRTGGVPVERIFVVGPQAGTSGTTAFSGDDLVTHAVTVPGPVEECVGG